jgi:hypothetical protein
LRIEWDPVEAPGYKGPIEYNVETARVPPSGNGKPTYQSTEKVKGKVFVNISVEDLPELGAALLKARAMKKRSREKKLIFTFFIRLSALTPHGSSAASAPSRLQITLTLHAQTIPRNGTGMVEEEADELDHDDEDLDEDGIVAQHRRHQKLKRAKEKQREKELEEELNKKPKQRPEDLFARRKAEKVSFFLAFFMSRKRGSWAIR